MTKERSGRHKTGLSVSPPPVTNQGEEMTEKLIIENRTNMPMEVVLDAFVSRVIRGGRVSNDKTQYCYLTTWEASRVQVASFKNEKSDRLVVSQC